MHRQLVARLVSDTKVQWWAFVVFFAMLLGLGSIRVLNERHELLATESQRLLKSTQMVEDNLVRQLEGVSAGLLSIERDLLYLRQASNDQALLNKRLESLSDAMPGVRALAVIDREGNYRASNLPDLVGQNFMYREYIQTPIARADDTLLYLSQPFTTTGNTFTVTLSRVMLNPQGQVHRLLLAALKPAFFKTLLASVLYAEDMRVGLAHEDGVVVVVVQPQRPGMVGKDLSAGPTHFATFMASGRAADVSVGIDPLTGERALIAQRIIQPENLIMSKRLVVGVARSTDALLAPWTIKAVQLGFVWVVLVGAGAILLVLVQRHNAEMLRVQGEIEQLRQQAEDEIRQLAYYDALTQLPNRRLLLDRLPLCMAASLRRGRYSALFFLDLDHFKTLNDQHGHSQGDELLKEVAQRLLGCVREEDTVARMGGDEFVLMLPELSPQAADAKARAEAVARKVLVALSQPYALSDVNFETSASIGITLFGQRSESVDEVMERADDAMYEAKAAGRNTFRFSQSDVGTH